MNTKQIASYCAGYVDGDGCFFIGKTINKRTGNVKYIHSFIISSTDKEILEFFSNEFGGTVRISSDLIVTHKTQYHFSLTGKKAIDLSEKILPYLVEKLEEAKTFLRSIKSTCKEEREFCFNRIRDLKHSENLIKRESIELLNNIEFSKVPSELDFCYLSGFIDAECCLGLTRYTDKNRPNHIYKAYIHCNNTKFPIFKWLVERFGGHYRFIGRNEKDPKQRNQIAWRICSKQLSYILKNIINFLRYKKPVCKELIEFDKTTLKNGGARHTETFRSHYAEVLIMRDCIFQNIHVLNRKGSII
jgi:hypothetical protein